MTTDLLTDDRTNDETQELKTKLLRVEVELLTEQLGDLNGGEDRGEQEHHRVRARWDHDARVLGQSKRRNELHRGDGCGIDAAELEVGLLESSKARHSMLGVVVTDVACLRTEKRVEYQLDTIYLHSDVSQTVQTKVIGVLTMAKIQ